MTPALLALMGALASPPARGETAVAGGVVQSREWRVRRQPQREEEFVGNVRYKGGSNAFSADWALFKHASQTWRARGRVDVKKTLASGDVLAAAGDEGFFDQASQKGFLEAHKGVRFSRTPAQGRPDEGETGRLEFTGRRRVLFQRGLHVWGPRIEAWADEGDYAQETGRLKLSGGRPVVWKLGPFYEPGTADAAADWTGAVKADEIAGFERPRSLSADGKAEGWLVFPRRQEGSR